MAIVGPLGLVHLIREVSVNEVRKQVSKAPRVVICGTAEERQRLRDLLLTDSRDGADSACLSQALIEIDLPLEGDEVVRSLSAQAVFTAAPPVDALRRLKVPVFQIADAEALRRVTRLVAHHDETWVLSLGRYVPGMRATMAEHLTGATATANAQIALISALPGVAPITQVLLPSAAVADIVLLTKNQILLVLKLAAMYGRPVQISARLWELMPVVGSAFCWRELARQAVGAAPGGVGVVAKGTVAYAGTYTVGRVAQVFYARGERVASGEERRIYREALGRAHGIVAAMWERIRHRDRQERSDGQGKEKADGPG